MWASRMTKSCCGAWCSTATTACCQRCGRCDSVPHTARQCCRWQHEHRRPPTCHRLRSAHSQENTLGQKFVVDATLTTDLSHAGKSDDIARTVNYAAVYE